MPENTTFELGYLDVGAVGGHEVLVDVGPLLADARLGGVDAAPAPDLAKQALAAAT